MKTLTALLLLALLRSPLASAQDFVRVPAGPAGIRSIAATANALYGLGRDGDLYRHEAGAWKSDVKAASLKLIQIAAAFNGMLYGLGESGVYRNGDGKTWETMASTNFFSQGALFVSPDDHLYASFKSSSVYTVVAFGAPNDWRKVDYSPGAAFSMRDGRLNGGVLAHDNDRPAKRVINTLDGQVLALRDQVYRIENRDKDYQQLPVAGTGKICDMTLGIYNKVYLLECGQ